MSAQPVFIGGVSSNRFVLLLASDNRRANFIGSALADGEYHMHDRDTEIRIRIGPNWKALLPGCVVAAVGTIALAVALIRWAAGASPLGGNPLPLLLVILVGVLGWLYVGFGLAGYASGDALRLREAIGAAIDEAEEGMP